MKSRCRFSIPSLAFGLLAFLTALPIGAQTKRCLSTSFTATLAGNQPFSRGIGEGLWFTAYQDSLYPVGSWTMMLGERSSPSNRYDTGWSLDYAGNEDWQLGPTHSRDVETAMKTSPRQLWFALSKSGITRLRSAQARLLSSDSRSFRGEHDTHKVVAEINVGLASVAISDYQLSAPNAEAKRQLSSVTITVAITTPASFRLLGGVSSACPSTAPLYNGP